MVSPNDVCLATNWSNGTQTGTDDRWFINIDDTATNYPIYSDANGTTAIWGLMVGRDDDWYASHPNSHCAFKQTGGTLNAASIVADTLAIGGAPLAAAAFSAQAVSEPSVLALRVLADLAFVGGFHPRK